MSDFEPGEGWREVDPESVGRRDLHLTDPETGRVVRSWVRVPPVPPLPTEVGTVIAIGAWRFVLMDAIDGCAWFLLCPNTREAAASMSAANVRAGAGYSPAFARAEAEQHGGFEVLSEPRAGAVKRAEESARRLTAKAVLDRVLHLDSWGDGIPISNIEALAREIGGES